MGVQKLLIIHGLPGNKEMVRKQTQIKSSNPILVVGCGVNSNRDLYFTLNGVYLGRRLTLSTAFAQRSYPLFCRHRRIATSCTRIVPASWFQGSIGHQS